MQLQIFVSKFSSGDFLIYSRRNNGTVLLTTVNSRDKNSKDLIQKIHGNTSLPELVTRILDISVENEPKIYCLGQKPSF